MENPPSIVSDTARSAMRAFLQCVSIAEPMLFELWRSHGLSLTQARCLALLRNESRSAGDLAKLLGLAAASVTRVLERLEQRGFIRRTIDLEDRRRIWVHLTDSGRTTLGGFDFWMSSPVMTAIKHMGDAERMQFTQVLEQFVGQVRHGLFDPEACARNYDAKE